VKGQPAAATWLSADLSDLAKIAALVGSLGVERMTMEVNW
jgi:hypothetical protein